MALDQYKTQILLLHSEQSTLDSLSSGFSDSYTVHCATSGSEALNTLVETPINVIVSAQDLPGMSGLDALREAKKRSPDTIGILLAGNAGAGLEAMVGDKEVFQVVRGKVTSENLLKLVENATRQMRLMALADSANDTAANPDEPVSEHIVMETSENGSTIISDGTGRMPKLDPKRVAAAVSIGSSSVDILVLTQDKEFLQTIKDSSRGMHEVHYANTLAQADQAIRKHKVGVAVVDAAMVGEKVEQLTQHLRKGSARLVAIVAGRRDDGEMLMDLINRGKVYRFLLKPVSPGRARLAVEASVKHHLEAPEAAFKMKGAAPAPKPATKASQTPAAKSAAAKPTATAKPAAKRAPVADKKDSTGMHRQAGKPGAALPVEPTIGPISAGSKDSPIDDSLADAFGDNDVSFTETVTGLLSSIGEKFSSAKSADSGVMESAIADPTPPIEAAAVPATAGTDGTMLKDPKILGIGAAAVVIVAGVLFWIFSGSDDMPSTNAPDDGRAAEEAELSTPSVSEAEVPLEAARVETPSVDVDALLDEARLARDAGQIFNPVGNNAIELFSIAVAAVPGDSTIAAELDAVLETALGMAESAILASNTDDAAAALDRVTAADPENPRLPFLIAQLSQMQLRGQLDTARVAIRETRFEDAAIALNAAGNLDPADTTQIDTVRAELDAARSEQQVGDVLAQANAKLESGELLSPANDNARYFYQLVLSNDPQNTAAQQGLTIISSKLVLQAQSEIRDGNLNGAEDLLANAAATDPSNAEIAATTSLLANARAAIVTRQRQIEAAAQAEKDRLAEAERIAAEEASAAAERQAEADRVAETERQALADQAADRSQQAQSEPAAQTEDAKEVPQQTDDAKTIVTIPADVDNKVAVVTNDDSTANAAKPADTELPRARRTTPTLNKNPVTVSSLNRTKYVAPKYPRGAQRRNQSGWVDVVFTVGVDGRVKDIEIPNSEPGETFVASAIKAVERWEFEAVVEDGVLIEKKAGVRLMFALE